MRKRKVEIVVVERKVDPNKWMITFSDLLTLLLTFFVLLLTMSSMDERKLRESFSQAVAQDQLDSSPGDSVIEVERVVPTLPEPAVGVSDGDMTTTSEAYAQLAQALEQMENKDIVTLEARDDEVVVRFRDTLTFERNRHDLTPEAEAVIRLIAPLLADLDFPILVEGHAARPAMREDVDPAAQMSLSLLRAHSVTRTLMESMPAAEQERFTMTGQSTRQPVDESTGPGDPANQRVEIIIQTGLKI
jgi:chemotaxis protein MotB